MIALVVTSHGGVYHTRARWGRSGPGPTSDGLRARTGRPRGRSLIGCCTSLT